MTVELHSATFFNYSADLSVLIRPKSIELTIDDSWSPFLQATAVCALPSESTIALLDPRQPAILMDFSLQANDAITGALKSFIHPQMFLRSRSINRKDNEMTLGLASAEALLQDYKLIDATPWTPPVTDLRTLVGLVLGRIGLSGYAPAGASPSAIIDPLLSIWKPGVSGWDYLQPLVQKAGLRLWSNENLFWQLEVPSNTLVGAITVAATTNAKNITDTIDRDSDEWYDAVVVHYSWTDTANVAREQWDVAQRVTSPTKVLTIDLDTAYPGPGAAAATLSRSVGKGQIVTPSVVSDYSAYPGQALTITNPGSPTVTGVLSAVTWRFPEMEMDIKSRGLLDLTNFSWAGLANGIPWSASGVGDTWANETI